MRPKNNKRRKSRRKKRGREEKREKKGRGGKAKEGKGEGRDTCSQSVTEKQNNPCKKVSVPSLELCKPGLHKLRGRFWRHWNAGKRTVNNVLSDLRVYDSISLSHQLQVRPLKETKQNKTQNNNK